MSASDGFPRGDFDRRCQVLRVASTAIVDANGEIDLTRADSWEVWRERWFRILPRQGKEFWRLQQVDAQITHVLQTLCDSESSQITSAMRVRFKGRIFELTSIINVEEADKLIEILAIERTA